MMNRLILYYLLLIPGVLLYIFGSDFVSILFLTFFVLLTISLPYSEKFTVPSLKSFISFLALITVLTAVFLLLFDFVNFLSTFNTYFVFLLALPLYLAFRLFTTPWIFLKNGFTAPLTAFKEDSKNNWLILAALSFLAIADYVPLLAFILAAPLSFFLASNLRLSVKL
ncbi:MAG: hypothetical protein GOV01_02315 [Candidatus Altiarchaeota archaeon]|nr:hypothetical protein [Candidatus Altiarchaeota archaeon]